LIVAAGVMPEYLQVKVILMQVKSIRALPDTIRCVIRDGDQMTRMRNETPFFFPAAVRAANKVCA
jgi:hypothetical protein